MKNLPLSVRLFVSSTFSDMDMERTALVTRVFPRIKTECEKRGISFLGVDLRWGITEEEANSGMSTSLCLEQIDRCGPFFIGMLGERYGWIPESVSDEDISKYPMLKEYEGRSITEIEMRYGAFRNHGDNGFCAFYLRDKQLTDSMTGDNCERVLESEVGLYGIEAAEKRCENRKARLNALKNDIIAHQKHVLNGYKSIEEFESRVFKDFLIWLDGTYPKTDSVLQKNIDYYIGESRRLYLQNQQFTNEFDSAVTGSRVPVVLYGTSGFGKTSFLNNWSSSIGCDVINVCIGADDRLSYWVETAMQIVNRVKQIYPETPYPDIDVGASMFFWMMDMFRNVNNESPQDQQESIRFMVTDKEENSFRSCFSKWLSELKCPRPLYIIINDTNLLDNWGGLEYLPWLPLKTSENVHLIISTNSQKFLNICRMREWKILNIPGIEKQNAKLYTNRYLEEYGKRLRAEHVSLIGSSMFSANIGCVKLVLDFLCNVASFSTIDMHVNRISAMKSPVLIGRYIYEYSASVLPDRLAQIFRTVLSLVRCSRRSLDESKVREIVEKKYAVTDVEWAIVGSHVYIWLDSGISKWRISGIYKQQAIDLYAALDVHRLLSAYYFEQYHRIRIPVAIHPRTTAEILNSTVYAREAIYHLCESRQWDALYTFVSDETVVNTLTKLNSFALHSAWLNLIMYSEYDLEEAYRDLLVEKNSDKNSELTSRLFAALCEFGLGKMAVRITGMDATDLLGGPMIVDTNGLSAEFIELYGRLGEFDRMPQNFMVLMRAMMAADNLQKISRTPQEKYLSTDSMLAVLMKQNGTSISEKMNDLVALHNYYAIETGNTRYMAKAEVRMAQMLRINRQYKACVDAAEQAMRFTVINGLAFETSSLMEISGLANYRLDNAAASVSLYTQQMRILNAMEFSNTFMSQLNLANARAVLNPEDGVTAYQALCDEAESKGETAVYYSSKGNLGKLLCDLERWAEAEDILKDCIRYNKNGGSKSTLVNAYYALICAYGKQEKYLEQYQYIVEARDDLIASQEMSMLAQIARMEEKCLVELESKQAADTMIRKWKNFFDEKGTGKMLLSEKPLISDSVLTEKEDSRDVSDALRKALFELTHAMMAQRESESGSAVKDYRSKLSGRFGYDINNPIMAFSALNSYEYLQALLQKDGKSTAYRRLGSCKNSFLPGMIDKYSIFDAESKDFLCELYVYMYSDAVSQQAPEGFVLRADFIEKHKESEARTKNQVREAREKRTLLSDLLDNLK